jgi:hypothetical protein
MKILGAMATRHLGSVQAWPKEFFMMVIIIQFIYLRAWQQPDKANYSQALKQQYRIKYNILKDISALQMKK